MTEPYSALQQARFQRARLGISMERYQQWRARRGSAKRRGIEWAFDLPEWNTWWDAWGTGRDVDQLVMARIGDEGPYAPGNVYPAPVKRKSDIPKAIMQAGVLRRKATLAARGRSLGEHLKVRGDAHPRSRAVLTPAGRFASITLAAEAYGVSRQAAFCWVRDGRPGWGYEEGEGSAVQADRAPSRAPALEAAVTGAEDAAGGGECG